MSKETEARVRDELLQSLYTGVLRCTLACAGAPARVEESAAIGVGVSACLQTQDMLLLPARGAAGFRVMRGLSAEKGASQTREQLAGVLSLPSNEQQAIALALGAAAAAAHGGHGALVCAVLPSGAACDERDSAATGARLPDTWHGAAVYAARAGLPLLLVSNKAAKQVRQAHLHAAALSPAIPVDRDDALAIYRVAYECAARARIGLGPSLIRCIPFAVAGAAGQQQDALERLESMLRQRGAFKNAWRRQLERQLVRELAR